MGPQILLSLRFLPSVSQYETISKGIPIVHNCIDKYCKYYCILYIVVYVIHAVKPHTNGMHWAPGMQQDGAPVCKSGHLSVYWPWVLQYLQRLVESIFRDYMVGCNTYDSILFQVALRRMVKVPNTEKGCMFEIMGVLLTLI